jgi:hypothetical protein
LIVHRANVPDSAAPISKAEVRERIRELIESRELLLPPQAQTPSRACDLDTQLSAGIKAGILEAAVSLPK